MSGLIMDLYRVQKRYLASKPDHVIEDLEHEADEQRKTADDYSVRVAATINHTACVMIKKERSATLNPQPSTLNPS